MDNKRFSLEEFKALFPGRFESRDQLLREYESFQAVFKHLDRMPVPELSAGQKAAIFRRSWQGWQRDRSWLWPWLAVFRQPAVTFAAGVVLGCTLMFVAVNARADVSQPVAVKQSVSADRAAGVDQPLTVEHMRDRQVYRGRIVEKLYPQIENPKIVLEKTQGSSTPQRVLYGTLDGGEVDVVWNL